MKSLTAKILTASLWILSSKLYGSVSLLIQNAAYTGDIAVGANYRKSWLSLQGSVGAANIKEEPLAQYNLGLMAHSKKLVSFSAYGGGRSMTTFNQNTYLILPGKYPKNYYPPTGQRFAGVVGLNFVSFETNMFLEYAVLDIEIEAIGRARGAIPDTGVGSFGFGVQFKILD